MKRDLAKLSNKVYDIVIIGGGIYGAAAAWNAASRGLSVALLDKEDFGSKTSFNSQKIIHGGLRYIQHFDLLRIRRYIREKKNLMHIAPHLVHPLPCLIPIYGYFMRSIMPFALKIYDLLSFNHEHLKFPKKKIQKGKIISKEECIRLIPGIEKDKLTGGIIWYDGQVYNTERLVLSYIKSAEQAGAQMANYVKVIGFLMDGNKIIGLKAIDLLSETEFEIKGNMVLNASGPWINTVLKNLKSNAIKRLPLSKMLVLVTSRRLAQIYAFGIPSKKKFTDKDAAFNKGFRYIFITPWRNHSLIGTAQELFQGETDDFRITKKDIEHFIEEINEAYPPASLSMKDISFYYGGLLPIDEINPNGDVTLTKHYKIYDHKKEGIDGLISIISVKYTEAGYVAQKAIDLVLKKIGKKSSECKAKQIPIYGGFVEEFNDFMEYAIKNMSQELDEEIARHLVYNYGSEYPEILKYIYENHRWGEKVSENSNVIKAEVLYGIRNEMAQKLSDVVLRRTELGTAEYPGDKALRVCASIMAKELEWDESRVQNELKEVMDIYEPCDLINESRG